MSADPTPRTAPHHEAKVGETWRFTHSNGLHTVDFRVTHFVGATPHGIVLSVQGGVSHRVGQSQSLSIPEDGLSTFWARVIPVSDAPAPISHEVIRTARVWPPTLDGPSAEWRCDVRLDWCTDESGLGRMEHGLGATPEEAYERACLIAAAFMAVPIPVARDRWPANGIDKRELV